MNTSSRRFINNAAAFSIAMVISRLIGFAYRLPLTSMLGDEGNAWYTTSYAVYTFMLVIAAGALPNAIAKLVSERIALGQYRNAHGIFRTAMVSSTFFGVAAAAGLWFGARFIAETLLNSPQSLTAIRVLSPALIILGAIGTFRGYFQGMQTAMPVAVSQIVEQIFKVSFALLLARVFIEPDRLYRGVAGAAGGTVIGAVFSLLVLIGLYALVQKDFNKRKIKDLSPPYEYDRTQLKIIVLTVVPIMLGMGLFAITTPLDQGMANVRLSASGAFSVEEINVLVGQFGGKFLLLIGLPTALVMSMSMAVIPAISAPHSGKDHYGVQSIINTALRLGMLIALPSAVGLAVMADPIIALLFRSFPEGGYMLRWGAIVIVFMAFNQIFTSSLQGIGKITMPLVAAFFGLLVKLPINWFLMAIPGIHMMGAVISTVMCFAVSSGLNLYFLYKSTQTMPRFGEALGKPMAASVIMGLACWGLYKGLGVISPDSLATVLTLVLGVVIYAVALILMRGLGSADVGMMPLPEKVKRWLLR
jgi:stage V sporulation protein B